jgi:hypothetical protein
MMTAQNILVWLIVAVAAYHIGKHMWGMLRGLVKAKSDANAACANCSFAPKEVAAPKPFVSLTEIHIQR